MAIDFTKPVTTDSYTAFASNLVGSITALGQWLDSTNTTITGTPPTYAKRYNRSTGLFEEYSGSVWAALPVGYLGKSGDTSTGTLNFTVDEGIRIKRDAGYIGGWNTANTTQTGFLKFNSGGAVDLAALNGANITFSVGGSARVSVDTAGALNVLAGNFSATNTNAQIIAQGSAGFGSFYAKGSGTNSGYLFLGNVTNGEQGRIEGTGAGLIFYTGSGATERMRLDTASLTTPLNIVSGAGVTTGTGVSTGAAFVEVGGSRTGDGASLIDFHAVSGTDFEARILRNGGVNGIMQYFQTGTGAHEFYNSGTLTFKLTSSNQIQDAAGNELGFKGLPSASVTTGAFVASDRGKCVYATGGVTVPNSTMAAGDVVTIINTTASAITITATVTTLRQAGTANTGNRTLAAYGIASVVFASGTLAFISGNVS